MLSSGLKLYWRSLLGDAIKLKAQSFDTSLFSFTPGMVVLGAAQLTVSIENTDIYASILSNIEYLVVICQIKILWGKKTLLIMVPCPSSEKGPMFCLWFCLNCHSVKKFYMFDFIWILYSDSVLYHPDCFRMGPGPDYFMLASKSNVQQESNPHYRN